HRDHHDLWIHFSPRNPEFQPCKSHQDVSRRTLQRLDLSLQLVVYSDINHIIMMIQENLPLGPLTTLKVGGPARYFTEAKTVAEVSEAVQFSRARNLPLFVLGGGSNLVVSDAGWAGLVLKIAISGIDARSGNENGKTL